MIRLRRSEIFKLLPDLNFNSGRCQIQNCFLPINPSQQIHNPLQTQISELYCEHWKQICSSITQCPQDMLSNSAISCDESFTDHAVSDSYKASINIWRNVNRCPVIDSWSVAKTVSFSIRASKILRPRRLRKLRLESEFAFFQSLSRLILLI